MDARASSPNTTTKLCGHHLMTLMLTTFKYSNVSAVNVTPPAISPTKEEVKEEHDMLHTIATGFERRLESSNKKLRLWHPSLNHLPIPSRQRS